jgi:hypothetical protein
MSSRKLRLALPNYSDVTAGFEETVNLALDAFGRQAISPMVVLGPIMRDGRGQVNRLGGISPMRGNRLFPAAAWYRLAMAHVIEVPLWLR